MGQRPAFWDKSVSTNQGTAAGALISGVKDKAGSADPGRRGAGSRGLNAWGWQRCLWHFCPGPAPEILGLGGFPDTAGRFLDQNCGLGARRAGEKILGTDPCRGWLVKGRGRAQEQPAPFFPQNFALCRAMGLPSAPLQKWEAAPALRSS